MMTNRQLLESLIAELKHVPVTDNTEWFKGYAAGRDDARRKIQDELFKIQAREYVRDNIVPTSPATRIIRENGDQPKPPVPPEVRYG